MTSNYAGRVLCIYGVRKLKEQQKHGNISSWKYSVPCKQYTVQYIKFNAKIFMKSGVLVYEESVGCKAY